MRACRITHGSLASHGPPSLHVRLRHHMSLKYQTASKIQFRLNLFFSVSDSPIVSLYLVRFLVVINIFHAPWAAATPMYAPPLCMNCFSLFHLRDECYNHICALLMDDAGISFEGRAAARRGGRSAPHFRRSGAVRRLRIQYDSALGRGRAPILASPAAIGRCGRYSF